MPPLRLRLLGELVAAEVAQTGDESATRTAWSRCLDRVDGSQGGAVEHPLTIDSTVNSLQRVVAAVSSVTATRLLTVRASAIADDDGHVLALIGAVPSDRTALVKALGANGFGFVSDLLLAVADDGTVEALPAPLAIAPPAPASAAQVLVGPDELGLPPCPLLLQLSAMVVLDRQPTAGTPTLHRLPAIEAVQLLASTVTGQASVHRLLQRVCAMVERAGAVHRLEYASDDEALVLLVRFLSSPRETPELWAAIGDPPGEQNQVGWGIKDARIRRAPYRDAVRLGDEALLSVDHVPVRLSPLGLTLWEAAVAAPRLAELVDVAVRAHGAHPDAEALVHDAVASMVDAGLLGYGQPRSIDAIFPDGRPRSVRWRLRRPPREPDALSGEQDARSK